MFHLGVGYETVISAIVLCFAFGWYLNERLRGVHEKLDHLADEFNGLREYLYELDPQFDDERELLKELNDSIKGGTISFSGMNHMELVKKKREEGRRTLDSPFHN
jgi:hypothetical protein